MSRIRDLSVLRDHARHVDSDEQHMADALDTAVGALAAVAGVIVVILMIAGAV